MAEQNSQQFWMQPSAADILRQAGEKLAEAMALLDRYSRTILSATPANEPDGPGTPAQATGVSMASAQYGGKTHTPQTHPSRCPGDIRKHDMQAYQLLEYRGLRQVEIARMLNEEHGTTYCQGQISRMIARVRRHMKATGLLRPPQITHRVKAVDPAVLELGKRTDGRPSNGRRSKGSG